MNKIQKALKALGLIFKNPYLLNAVLNHEEVKKKEVIAKYNMPQGLPVVAIDTMFPDFSQRVSPYAALSGATTPMDLALLKSLAQKFNVSNYFEIGTWRGESAANVASVAAHCTTLNLPKDKLLKLSHSEDYANLHGFFSRPCDNITHLYGDSQDFDFEPFFKSFDMIFIDGDHHYEAVKRDTETAFSLLKDEHSIIVWHDYAFDPETIRWSVFAGILDGTPADKRAGLFHASNTMCAVYIPQAFNNQMLTPYQKPNFFFNVDLTLQKI